MACIDNALVVGGGIAGVSAAIGLRDRGIGVTIAEVQEEWGPLGVGLVLQGPALRAFGSLGLLDDVAAAGVAVDSIHVGDASGEVRTSIPLTALCGPDRPHAVTIRRPALHRVLAQHAASRGVVVRTGLTVAALEQDGAGVDVAFSDGATGRFDLVVGADGVRSTVRSLAMGERAPEPSFTGQVVWRVMLPRRDELGDRLLMFYSDRNKIGFSPMSADEMYLFLVQNVEDRGRPAPERLPALLRDQLAPYSGWIADVASGISDRTAINYRLIDTILMPEPWHAGRVVIIGDAAHATTPHLASGAGIAIEDAVVLGEVLSGGDDVSRALSDFMVRRFERCRMVVESGVQLGRWERDPEPDADPVGLTARSLAALEQPI